LDGGSMGAVYRVTVKVGGKSGRFIYNRNRLHKAGYEPKHKLKHREKIKAMKQEEIECYS